MTEGSTSECESINALCRRVVRRQMEESNEHPLVSSRIPYEYATHLRTLYINTRDSYHYKHARCNVMHRKCTVSVRGSNPPHTVNSPLQPTRRTTTEPCNENPYPSGTPRPSNAHPPGYNTDFKHIHTYTNYKKKLDATVVLEAQLLGERQQRDTTGR